MPRWNLAWLLGIAAVVSVGFAASQSSPSREKDKDYELVRLLVDVLSEVDHNYVRELDPEAKRKLVEDMINGGLERLDPYSAFINAQKFKQFDKDSKGEFGGIGIEINADRQTGLLTVVSLLVGTPAYEAGVQAGDLIIKVDGKATDTLSVNDAVDMIQGEPGKPITLTVVHEGAKEAVDLTMKRAVIHVASVRGDLRQPDDPQSWDFFLDKANKIAYIRLVAFTRTTSEELRKAVEQLQQEGLRGLILDLRNNPGGLLQSAVEVSDLFLTQGRIVSTRGRNKDEDVREFDAHEEGTLLLPADKYPMVLLINRFSASASEIVSAALQDHHRAVIIGERSYGKGSVQNVIKMENGTSALKLTTASYWRPSGKNIHRFPDSKDTDEWGVKPNPGFEVTLTDEERLGYLIYRRDRDIVLGKDTPKPPDHPNPAQGKKDKAPKPFVDKVLEKALEHLREEIKKVQAAAPPPETKVG
ncbi:MAG: S41 family peptidase [Planctomycetes bacterium]|nr:S41 family peptidase [Planctomycetota bacterium]